MRRGAVRWARGWAAGTSGNDDEARQRACARGVAMSDLMSMSVSTRREISRFDFGESDSEMGVLERPCPLPWLAYGKKASRSWSSAWMTADVALASTRLGLRLREREAPRSQGGSGNAPLKERCERGVPTRGPNTTHLG